MKRAAKIFSIIVILSLLGTAAAFAETKLILNVFMPRKHTMFTGMLKPWGDSVEKATQGRIKIEYSASSLAPVPRQFDAVRKGIFDIGMDQHNFNPKRFVLPTVGSMPFAAPGSEATSVASWRVHEKFFAPANEYEGVKFLSITCLGPYHLFTSKKPVKTVADSKNLKIRISTRYGKEISDAFEFVMVAVPGPASYEIVSKGTVDGTTFSFSDVFNFRISKFMKNVLVIPGGLYTATFALIMNQKTWDSLSKEDQKAIESVSGEKFARYGRSWDESDRASWDKLQKAGIKVAFISQSDRAALEKKLAFIPEQWIEAANKRGVDGAAALAYYREQVKELSKNTWRPSP